MKRKRFLLPILFLLCGATLGYSEDAELDQAQPTIELINEDVSYEPEEFIEEIGEDFPELSSEEVVNDSEEYLTEVEVEEAIPHCEDDDYASISCESEGPDEDYVCVAGEEDGYEPEEYLTAVDVEEAILQCEGEDYAAIACEIEGPDEGCVCVASEEESECADVTSLSDEPAILGLGLTESMALDSRLNLHEYFAHDSDVTTESADEFFSFSEFGVEVKKAGLYRVSFYQGLSSGSLPCDVAVVLKQGFGRDNVKRAQRIKLKRGDFTDISFSKILNIREGEKISLKMWPITGEAVLEGEFHSSGFTIEALSH